jgi:hypothetical protein
MVLECYAAGYCIAEVTVNAISEETSAADSVAPNLLMSPGGYSTFVGVTLAATSFAVCR